MGIRIFFFLLGFGLTVIGCTYIITYLNLCTLGYSLKDYLQFIFSRVECLSAIVGFSIMTISIYKKGRSKRHGLYL